MRSMRVARKLLLEVNARKRGLLPGGFDKRKWNSGKRNKKSRFVRKLEGPAHLPSVFNRDNYNSMQLILDFPDKRFRFLRIKSLLFFRGAVKHNHRLMARSLSKV